MNLVGRFVAKSQREGSNVVIWRIEAADDEVISKSAAAIVDRLGEQLAAITQAIQQILERDIAELRGDAQLLGLLHKSTEGNVETVFNALHYAIPIERVGPPTAALEYARRLAQHGVPSNALVRAYRLGHQALLAMVVEAINEADLDPALGLAVFGRMTTVTFHPTGAWPSN